MWPFKKKPPFEPPAHIVVPGLNPECTIFAPLFVDSIAYLRLLHLDGPEATEAVSLVVKCCASVSNPYEDTCRFLRQGYWRPHLVSAVAVATLAPDAQANRDLWAAIDSGSWVTPQLAAVAFLRDPMFASQAWERLQAGGRVGTSRSAGLTVPERHVSTGPGGAVELSAKAGPHSSDW